VTVVLVEVVPPSPVQEIEYRVVAGGLTTFEPKMAVELVQDALQLSAFVEPHASVELSPEAIEGGVAVRVTVGAVGQGLEATA
jgi:hypothetical protein